MHHAKRARRAKTRHERRIARPRPSAVPRRATSQRDARSIARGPPSRRSGRGVAVIVRTRSTSRALYGRATRADCASQAIAAHSPLLFPLSSLAATLPTFCVPGRGNTRVTIPNRRSLPCRIYRYYNNLRYFLFVLRTVVIIFSPRVTGKGVPEGGGEGLEVGTLHEPSC